MKEPRMVALTGGIGSGKTTVLNYFKDRGVPCFIADEEAKKIMTEDRLIVNAIKNEFGEKAFTEENQLNTAYLASEVFSDEDKLEKLNNIVHPAVRDHFNCWVKQQNAPFIIYESALVFENNQEYFFDDIILVTAPVEERIKRIKKRSGLSETDIKKRMSRQMNDNLKTEKATYIIKNIEIRELKDKTNNIYNKILNKIN